METRLAGDLSDWNAVQLTGELHQRRRSLAVEAVERSMKCSACGKRGARITPLMVEW